MLLSGRQVSFQHLFSKKGVDKAPLVATSIRPWVLPIVGLLTIALLITALVALISAWQLRAEKLRKLDEAAYQLSQSLDREVEVQRALLLGLSSSPLLARHDLKAFHAQLQATPVLDETWLVLFDDEWLLLHSRFPYGTKLPRIAEFNPADNFYSQLRAKRFLVTGRFYGVQLKVTAVTVNIAVPRPGTDSFYYLANVIGDARFERIIRSHRFDPEMTIWIADWRKQGLIRVSQSSAEAGPAVPAGLAKTLQDGFSETSYAGRVNAIDNNREVVMSFYRSPFTHWTSAASIDQAELNAPFWDLAQPIGVAALLLALAGSVAFRLFRREVQSIERAADEAQQEVLCLSQELQGTQESERLKIARELHDSTLQHLTGALLEAKGLYGAGNAIAGNVGRSISQALDELRNFSFLLMPHELNNRSLTEALAEFADTFAKRTGLVVDVELDAAVNRLPKTAQHALLRIGQEALANIFRHAGATRVFLETGTSGAWATLRVTDDGQTARGRPAEWFEQKSGVGLASMRSRLTPLGGRLTVEGLAGGVRLTATLPMD